MTFQSPGFTETPPNYPNTMFCQWDFTAPADMLISVDFTTFNLEDSKDYVYVGTTTGVGPLARQFSYTGSSLPIKWISSGNTVSIAIDTNDEQEVSHQGFQVTLTATDPTSKHVHFHN